MAVRTHGSTGRSPGAGEGGEHLDPRVVRSRAAVLDATVDLLARRGWSGTTVEAVAETSGVAKTTIYRHWPGRAGLIRDAFDSLAGEVAVETSDDLDADLVTMLCNLADALEESQWAAVLPALVEGAARDRGLARLAADLGDRQRAALVERIEEAIRAEVLPPDTEVDIMVRMLTDPLFSRRLLSRDRTTTRFVETLVRRTLRAFAAPAAGGRA